MADIALYCGWKIAGKPRSPMARLASKSCEPLRSIFSRNTLAKRLAKPYFGGRGANYESQSRHLIQVIPLLAGSIDLGLQSERRLQFLPM